MTAPEWKDESIRWQNFDVGNVETMRDKRFDQVKSILDES